MIEDCFWWVVKSKARQEFKAERALGQQGFITYCPIYQKEIKRGSQFRTEPQPLFSGYMFIKANDFAKKNHYLIRSTRGVISLLKIGETILSASHEIIKILKLNQSQEGSIINSYFTPGCSVKIMQGVYQGIEAIYKIDSGSDRAIVMLSILQKQTELIIEKKDLIKN